MWKSAPLLALALTAACSAPLNATYKGTSPQPLDATMRCVSAAADSLGYKPVLVNHKRSVEATRKDSVLAAYEDARIEKITASGDNSKDNAGASSLKVTAATFSQHWTRIGLESQEIPASDRVKKDAQIVMARCSSGN